MVTKAPSASRIALPPLPYPVDALAPHISARTLELHHGKHHKAYVDKLRELIAGTKFAEMPLDEIVRTSAGHIDSAKIFNQAAQAWNHAFYWRSLAPAPKPPNGDLTRLIERDFADLKGLSDALVKAAVEQFGSGWVWLVVEQGALKVTHTGNADTPFARGVTCLLTFDVWEHAYYLDYQNRREEHARACVEHLLNWDFAAANLAARTDQAA